MPALFATIVRYQQSKFNLPAHRVEALNKAFSFVQTSQVDYLNAFTHSS